MLLKKKNSNLHSKGSGTDGFGNKAKHQGNGSMPPAHTVLNTQQLEN